MFFKIVMGIITLVALLAFYFFAVYGTVLFFKNLETKHNQKNKEVKFNDEDNLQ